MLGAEAASKQIIERDKNLVTLGAASIATPGYSFRQTGHDALPRRIGSRVRDPGPRCLLRRKSDAGQGNRHRHLDHGGDRHRDPDGARPDGRILAPIMPWRSFANLTKSDALAIAAFLKSLPPVRNAVPGPFGPAEKPTSFVMKIVPPEDAAAK